MWQKVFVIIYSFRVNWWELSVIFTSNNFKVKCISLLNYAGFKKEQQIYLEFLEKITFLNIKGKSGAKFLLPRSN